MPNLTIFNNIVEFSFLVCYNKKIREILLKQESSYGKNTTNTTKKEQFCKNFNL